MFELLLSKELKQLSQALTKLPSQVYAVGGCVRDSYLKIKSHDLDVVFDTDNFQEVKNAALSLAKEFSANLTLLDEKRGFYRLIFSSNNYADICTRIGNSIKEDLSNRDFTINAIAYDLRENSILDPFGGLEDLENRTLKCVTKDSFASDPLRVLRALRFLCRFDLKCSPNLVKAAKKNTTGLKKIASERICDELFSALKYNITNHWYFIENTQLFNWIIYDSSLVDFSTAGSLINLDKACNYLNLCDTLLDTNLGFCKELSLYFENVGYADYSKQTDSSRALTCLLKLFKDYFSQCLAASRSRLELIKIATVLLCQKEELNIASAFNFFNNVNLSNKERRYLSQIKLYYKEPLNLYLNSSPKSNFYKLYKKCPLCFPELLIISWFSVIHDIKRGKEIVSLGISQKDLSGFMQNYSRHICGILADYFWGGPLLHPKVPVTGLEISEYFKLQAGPVIKDVLEHLAGISVDKGAMSLNEALKATEDYLKNI